jgi:hypothetical protein
MALGAVVVDRLTACLVDAAPMRLGSDGEREGGVFPIEQPISEFRQYAVESASLRSLSPVTPAML